MPYPSPVVGSMWRHKKQKHVEQVLSVDHGKARKGTLVIYLYNPENNFYWDIEDWDFYRTYEPVEALKITIPTGVRSQGTWVHSYKGSFSNDL